MKVSIEREELVELAGHVGDLKPSIAQAMDYRGLATTWQSAMTLLNVMIGKGEGPSACKGCHFDGDCHMQRGGGVTECTMRVPATPPAPKADHFDGSALGPRGHTDPGDENLVVEGWLPPQYVARQEMEAAIAKAAEEYHKMHHIPAEKPVEQADAAVEGENTGDDERLDDPDYDPMTIAGQAYVTPQQLADTMKMHSDGMGHIARWAVDFRLDEIRGEIKAAVDAALKAHEEKRHDVGQPSHDDCAHFIVCGMPKPCERGCDFYQKPLKS